MSTLKVNTIQNTSGSHGSTPEEIAKGRAKAYVNCAGGSGSSSGGGISINSSFNVTSVTDQGVGRCRITFSDTMTNSNLCAVFGFSRSDSNMIVYNDADDAKAATHIDVRTTFSWSSGGNAGDVGQLYVAIFGD
tara:strand:- start:15 stop:416 length:402 start_codon:yes stop_codon:yes gene_type:complete